jgi:hypothetical protein
LIAELMKRRIPLFNMEEALRVYKSSARLPHTPPPSAYLFADSPPKVSRWTGPHSQGLKESWQPGANHLGPDFMDVKELHYYIVKSTWR